jgi:uncharacterized membrane protein
LVVLMGAGAAIRQFFVARHKAKLAGVAPPWGWAAAGVAAIVALVFALAPAPRVESAAATPATQADVQAVVERRCVVCHNAAVQQKNVALHTPELIRRHAQAVHQQAVVLKTMPLNDATGITADERATIGRWYEAGTP